ncbi:MAG: type IV pilin protein [Oceanospirillaceae bacterium]
MNQKGMTLIELMIVVAIIGIITAIAYPSYQSYVQQTKRTLAQGHLLELAQWMERRFTADGMYPNPPASVALPFTQTPKTGNAAYAFSLTIATSSTFTLQAAVDIAGPQVGDECGNLTMNQIGITGALANGAPADCWRY